MQEGTRVLTWWLARDKSHDRADVTTVCWFGNNSFERKG